MAVPRSAPVPSRRPATIQRQPRAIRLEGPIENRDRRAALRPPRARDYVSSPTCIRLLTSANSLSVLYVHRVVSASVRCPSDPNGCP